MRGTAAAAKYDDENDSSVRLVSFFVDDIYYRERRCCSAGGQVDDPSWERLVHRGGIQLFCVRRVASQKRLSSQSLAGEAPRSVWLTSPSCYTCARQGCPHGAARSEPHAPVNVPPHPVAIEPGPALAPVGQAVAEAILEAGNLVVAQPQLRQRLDGPNRIRDAATELVPPEAPVAAGVPLLKAAR